MIHLLNKLPRLMVLTETIAGRPVTIFHVGNRYIIFTGERDHLDYLDYHPPYIEYEKPATDRDVARMREEIERTREQIRLLQSGWF